MFNEFMAQVGWHIVGLILAAIVTYLLAFVKSKLACWFDTSEKKKIARQCVLFVEQVYKDVHGQEKLERALEAVEPLLKERGIPFDALEMRVWIESSLAELNHVFDEEEPAAKAPAMEEPAKEKPAVDEPVRPASFYISNGEEEPPTTE